MKLMNNTTGEYQALQEMLTKKNRFNLFTSLLFHTTQNVNPYLFRAEPRRIGAYKPHPPCHAMSLCANKQYLIYKWLHQALKAIIIQESVCVVHEAFMQTVQQVI